MGSLQRVSHLQKLSKLLHCHTMCISLGLEFPFLHLSFSLRDFLQVVTGRKFIKVSGDISGEMCTNIYSPQTKNQCQTK